MSNQISNVKSNTTIINEENTMTNNNQAPATLPLTHVHAEVDCVSEDYNGEYSTRYLSYKVNRLVEDAQMEASDEESAAEAVQKVLANVSAQAETFWGQLDGEPNDSFDGVETGTTESREGLLRFAKDNVGQTLSQLIRGVRFEGGFVKVNFDDLINSARFDQEFYGDIDHCWEAAEAAADQYVLQSNATFVLAA